MASKLLRTSLPRRTLCPPSTTNTTLNTTRKPLITQTRLAHQDYGSGAGNPAGENPQDQGPNPSEDKEHPGPPPPKVASKGNGGDKSGEKKQGGGSEKKGESDVSSSGGADAQQAKNGARPTILREGQGMGDGVDKEDVRRHNEEMARRADKPAEKVKDEEVHKDKVSKEFWAGTGGADKDP